MEAILPPQSVLSSECPRRGCPGLRLEGMAMVWDAFFFLNAVLYTHCSLKSVQHPFRAGFIQDSLQLGLVR